MIPDEAVEAAEEVLNRLSAMEPGEELAKAVLEAAAPYLKSEALREAVEAFPLETIVAPDNAVVWMMRRAEQLEQDTK